MLHAAKRLALPASGPATASPPAADSAAAHDPTAASRGPQVACLTLQGLLPRTQPSRGYCQSVAAPTLIDSHRCPSALRHQRLALMLLPCTSGLHMPPANAHGALKDATMGDANSPGPNLS